MLAQAVSAAVLTFVPINGPVWAQHAVDRMHVPVPPAQTVTLGECPGYDASEVAACNFITADSPIYINPSPLDTPTSLSEVLYRELGGRFETLAMYPWAIDHFNRLVDHPALTANVADAAEVFEDAYADCAIGLAPQRPSLQHPADRWIDTAGYDPSRRQHQRVCQLIQRVGAHARLPMPVSLGQRPSRRSRADRDTRPAMRKACRPRC